MIGERLFRKATAGRKSSPVIYDIARGELLGKGCYREVSVFKFNPEYVIKFEFGNERGMFCNVAEWRNFINAKETPLEKWLAPCEFINETGQLLIQKRVEFNDKFPDKIPWQFTDVHAKNFGWIGKQFVCCDYPWLRTGYHPKFRTVKKWRGR